MISRVQSSLLTVRNSHGKSHVDDWAKPETSESQSTVSVISLLEDIETWQRKVWTDCPPINMLKRVVYASSSKQPYVIALCDSCSDVGAINQKTQADARTD